MDKVFLMVALIVLVGALIVEHNTRKDKVLGQTTTITTEVYSHKCAYTNGDFKDIKNGYVSFTSKICL